MQSDSCLPGHGHRYALKFQFTSMQSRCPMSSGWNFLMVGMGGALGACLRYGTSLLLAGVSPRFPFPTLTVNVLGALVAGLLATWFWQRGLLGTPLQLMLVVGVLGGFTTFSAFSVETLRLVEAGELTLASINVMLNVVGSLLAVLAGAWLARLLPVS